MLRDGDEKCSCGSQREHLARLAGTARAWGHKIVEPVTVNGVPRPDVDLARVDYWQTQYVLAGTRQVCFAAPQLSSLALVLDADVAV